MRRWRSYASSSTIHKLTRCAPGTNLSTLDLHHALVAVVGVKFFLEFHDGVISLVEARGERDHDVSLLDQELFVPTESARER